MEGELSLCRRMKPREWNGGVGPHDESLPRNGACARIARRRGSVKADDDEVCVVGWGTAEAAETEGPAQPVVVGRQSGAVGADPVG